MIKALQSETQELNGICRDDRKKFKISFTWDGL